MKQVHKKTLVNVSLKLSPELLKRADKASQIEDRTRSAIVRRALIAYLTRHLPTEEATASDKRAIAQGRADLKAGRFKTFEQIRHDVDIDLRKKSRKTA